MSSRAATATKALLLLVAGAFCWHLVGRSAGVGEPWDADAYWRLYYPLSLGLSALAGLWFRKHGWMAGAIVTFAQWPVMWLNGGAGPLWTAGVLMLLLLGVPAMALAALAGGVASRRRTK